METALATAMATTETAMMTGAKMAMTMMAVTTTSTVAYNNDENNCVSYDDCNGVNGEEYNCTGSSDANRNNPLNLLSTVSSQVANLEATNGTVSKMKTKPFTSAGTGMEVNESTVLIVIDSSDDDYNEGDDASHTIKAYRIAIGTKVYKSNCKMVLQSNKSTPYIKLLFWDNEKSRTEKVYIDIIKELKDVKYHFAPEDDTVEGAAAGDIVSLIAFRVTSSDDNYISVEPEKDTELKVRIACDIAIVIHHPHTKAWF
jgi:hypothetical protein